MPIRKKAFDIASWLAVGATMIVIFLFSHQNGDASGDTSSGILDFINRLIGVEIPSIVLRKAAHMFEYFVLNILFFIVLARTVKRISPKWSFVFTAIYAASDEIHQAFVPGRACQFTDWLIDCTGAILGLLLCLFILRLKCSNRSKTEV